jgi:prepilin-type N-terminal cleavage/methylation domain-containing protein
MKKYKSKSAFTLAEILITLLIIGVVASLVIPNIINDTQNAEYVTGLKKTYSDFSQAFKLLQVENGGSIVPVFSDDTTTNYGNGNALNAFLTKMNYSKNCRTSMGCWYDTQRYYLGGTVANSKLDTSWVNRYEKAILSNGAMVILGIDSTSCTDDRGSGPLDSSVCGDIDIDVNGEKGPNKIGRDYFSFWITQTGIYPKNTYNDGYSCSKTASTYTTCFGCSGKVLSENGMNY